MIFHIFSIYDSKAEAYNTPLYLAAKGQAVRAFDDQVNKEGSEIGNHPEDYTLFCLGTFDDSTGQHEPYETPQSLGVAIEFKRS